MPQEYRVPVDGGNFTLVAPTESEGILILRRGKPWHEVRDQSLTWPLFALMCELRAAREVLTAARDTLSSSTEGIAPILELRRAVELHDRSIPDHTESYSRPQDPEPLPSEETTTKPRPRENDGQRYSQDEMTPYIDIKRQNAWVTRAREFGAALAMMEQAPEREVQKFSKKPSIGTGNYTTVQAAPAADPKDLTYQESDGSLPSSKLLDTGKTKPAPQQTVTIRILECSRHGFMAVSVGVGPNHQRVTPNKCCGSWRTVRKWEISTADLKRAGLTLL